MDEFSDYREKLTFKIPENVTAGSREIFLSVMGDIIGPALSNLDGLIEEPMGCGEQNIARLFPNILILEYLLNSGQIDFDRELQQRLLENIKHGYRIG